jgi:uncharacterized protein YndB with AHSA1/START domain
MSKPQFVYTTYIETSAEKLWYALTDGDFTERYWFGHRAASDWKAGSPYKFVAPDGHSIEGKVLISEPPKRLAYSWDSSCSADAKLERTSRVTFDLEPRGKVIKLTVIHDNLDEGGKTLRDISGGWPMVLASLKSLLETGHVPVIDPPPAVAKEAAHAEA